MKNFLLIMCSFILTTIYCAEIEIMPNEKFWSNVGVTGSEAVKKARETIPQPYHDNSNWTSPILSCEQGFKYQEFTDSCENRRRNLGLVIARVSIKENL